MVQLSLFCTVMILRYSNLLNDIVLFEKRKKNTLDAHRHDITVVEPEK